MNERVIDVWFTRDNPETSRIVMWFVREPQWWSTRDERGMWVGEANFQQGRLCLAFNTGEQDDALRTWLPRLRGGPRSIVRRELVIREARDER